MKKVRQLKGVHLFSCRTDARPPLSLAFHGLPQVRTRTYGASPFPVLALIVEIWDEQVKSNLFSISLLMQKYENNLILDYLHSDICRRRCRHRPEKWDVTCKKG